jgi:glycosyltransferase involved in cell wall biosynthesis
MFSVVIPLYNKSNTILNSIQTILNQTFKDFEVIIVNDGSTDDSIQKIKKYIFDNRIKIIDQKNQGVSVARNEGVKNATFDYIAFIDGDDEWLPEYLSKMKYAIDMYPNSEMFCSAGLGRNGDGILNKRQINKLDGKVLPFNFFENPHVFLHIGSTVVTRNLFEKVKGFPVGMKRNEDFAFLYSAALFTNPIYSGFPTMVYVGDITGQATSINLNDNINLVDDVIKRYDITYRNWLKSGSTNTNYITFMKYELRHGFMINLFNNEFRINIYYLNNLNADILRHFNFLDQLFLKYSYFKIFGIIYFKLSKIKWLLNGYQRVK